MQATEAQLEGRVLSLERRLRRHQFILFCMLVAGVTLATVGARQATPSVPETLTVRRIVVLDEQGRHRITLGEDPRDTQRRSRSCSMHLYDTQGSERFGVGTMEDLSVVLGMDAPQGVGAAMRDRIGLVVEPDGSARIDLIDNRTMIPVRLSSEADGQGGVDFLDYDLEKMKVTVTRLNSKGETKRELPLGDGK